jgi:hypothetical protein
VFPFEDGSSWLAKDLIFEIGPSQEIKSVNYAFRFSGPVTALRARAKSKSSHGSVTPTPNKLVPTGNISHTRRNFRKANMSLSHLPPELLSLILANIFPDEWSNYFHGREVLDLRTICRKYSKRVF